MESLFLKMRCYAKVLVLILPCVAFWGCATLKGAADSTNTMIKELDTDLIVCQFKDCPGYDEYKKAKQLFQDSDYQGALVNIQISVSKDPLKEKYREENKRISWRYSQMFIRRK